MIVHLVSHDDPEHGTLLEWFETRAPGLRRKTDLISDGERGVDLIEVDIPTGRKSDLVAWLNANYNTDNG